MPGKQNIPIWVTMLIGVVAALIGTWIAKEAGWADTKGVGWLEIITQVVLAAFGVFAVAGAYGRRGVRF